MDSTCPSRCHEDEGWGKCGFEVKDITAAVACCYACTALSLHCRHDGLTHTLDPCTFAL